MTMTRRFLLAGIACIALSAAVGLPGPVFAAEGPRDILERVYASYTSDQPVQPTYTADLSEALADAEKHPGFDFFIDAQDYDKVSADVVLVSQSDKAALVKVSATNFGKVRKLEVDFVKDASAWKISNVRYPGAEPFDLRSSVGLPAR